MLNPRSERKALDALDLADVLASMGVVTSSDSSTTCSYPLVHFRPQQHVAPPHNPFALDPSLVFRRASEPTPPIHALPPVHGLWRAATDGHVDPSLVDTSFIRNAGASGVWQNTTNTRVEPNVVNTSVFLQNASGITAHQLQQEGPRLTRRDVYSFSRLSTVFHLPQHKACSELRRRMEAEGLVGYRLSSLKLLIKCYDLQRWPYRKARQSVERLQGALRGALRLLSHIVPCYAPCDALSTLSTTTTGIHRCTHTCATWPRRCRACKPGRATRLHVLNCASRRLPPSSNCVSSTECARPPWCPKSLLSFMNSARSLTRCNMNDTGRFVLHILFDIHCQLC